MSFIKKLSSKPLILVSQSQPEPEREGGQFVVKVKDEIVDEKQFVGPWKGSTYTSSMGKSEVKF